MPDKAWKAGERRVARYFGTERNALSGGNSKVTRSDSLHKELFIECKYRKSHSVVTLWQDTLEKARAEGKVPVVALMQKGLRGFWIVMHSEDFEKVAGALNDPEA